MTLLPPVDEKGILVKFSCVHAFLGFSETQITSDGQSLWAKFTRPASNLDKAFKLNHNQERDFKNIWNKLAKNCPDRIESEEFERDGSQSTLILYFDQPKTLSWAFPTSNHGKLTSILDFLATLRRRHQTDGHIN